MTKSAEELFKILKAHYRTGQTGRIARLLMSIHNGRTRIAFYGDLVGFDDSITRLVITVITEFFTGAYKDGDFNPIAEWLIDDMGYLDDVSLEERKEWIRDNEGDLRGEYSTRSTPRRRDADDEESFEEFANRRWKESEEARWA